MQLDVQSGAAGAPHRVYSPWLLHIWNSRTLSMTDIKLITKGKTATIALPEILDLSAAEPLKAALEKALAGGRSFKLDAKNVERLSTPCIQVLLAAKRAMKDAGMSFTLTSPSDAFIDTFNDLGVFSHLKKWTIAG